MAQSRWNRTDHLRFLGFIFNGARGFNPSGYKSSDWQGLDEVSILTGMPAGFRSNLLRLKGLKTIYTRDLTITQVSGIMLRLSEKFSE